MAETFQFDLVSPERRLVSTEAKSAQIPGIEGDFTALPQHAPFLTTLRPGIVSVAGAQGESAYFVTGGFAEVSPESASVLAEEAVEKADLTRGFLDEKIEAAEKAQSEAGDDRKALLAQRVSDLRACLSLVGG